MRIETKPRIIFIDEYVNLGKELGIALNCEVGISSDAKDFLYNRNPLDYNVAVIHYSQDCPVDGTQLLSEFLRRKNPEMIIIGKSNNTLRELKKDNMAKQLYDDMIVWDNRNLDEKLKAILEKYGFEFPEQEK